MININVPDLPYEELKGIKVCHLGYRTSAAEVIKQEDPRGEISIGLVRQACRNMMVKTPISMQ